MYIESYGLEWWELDDLQTVADWTELVQQYGNLYAFALVTRWKELVVELMGYAFPRFENKLWVLDADDRIFRADQIDVNNLSM